jgi:serine/threonine-protein kinase
MLELRTLGALELRRVGDSAPAPVALQTKRLVLLAHLRSAPSAGFRRRDSVLALFWPDLDQEHARGALRQALHALRSTLGEGVIHTRAESEIGVDGSMLQWDAQQMAVALEAGQYAAALALYRGDFLDGVFVAGASPELEEWVAGERTRLRQLAARAAWGVAAAPAGRAEAGHAVRQAVRLSGADESALRRGITSLDQQGDHAGAVALYEEFARRMARDLEAEPSTETRDLIATLRSRVAPAVARKTKLEVSEAFAVSPPDDDVPASPPTPPARSRRLTVAAVILGIAALLIVALRLSPGAKRPGESNVVVVAPFQMSGADPSHAWMQEGMVDLLSIRLGGSGGLKLADPATTIASWRRDASRDMMADPMESARRVAAGVGAEWVVTGSLAGSADRIILSATLEAVANRQVIARASAEGPTDSIPVLVDRLALQLLGGSTGLDEDRLASLTSPSFPAIRAFLDGRAAFRRGRREQARARFREALALDSNFALAGMELVRVAAWIGTDEDIRFGTERSLAGRQRLGTSDRAVLDAQTAIPRDASELFRIWNAAVTAQPERAETWYSLGDIYFHVGAFAGVDDALTRAEEAFRQGWRLDSAASVGRVDGPAVAEPVEHMIQLAHLRRDTAEVRRLVALLIAADSSSSLARALGWHQAMLAGDGADVRRSWIEHADHHGVDMLSLFIIGTGEGIADFPLVVKTDQRWITLHDRGFGDFELTIYALLRGRPGDVPAGATRPERRPPSAQRAWLRYALWWDGDTTGVTAVARALEASSSKAAVTPDEERDKLLGLCSVGLWHATRGEFASARDAGRQLGAVRLAGLVGEDSMRFADHAMLCAALIDATVATGLASSDSRAKVWVADSLARRFVFVMASAPRLPETNLILARLWEAQGDLPRALAALRRRGSSLMEPPYFMTTFLREEGRLAALTGDTAGAMRAYRHYLGLRYDPEPRLVPQVDWVRRELARLEGVVSPRDVVRRNRAGTS